MTTFFKRGGRFLLCLLLLGPAARAQFSPSEVAQYQRRLRAMRFDHRFWDAPPDSLQRVLATQRGDSERLQTLEHLQYIQYEAAPQTTLAEDQEALALATRLHYAERAPLRLLLAAHRLGQAKPPQLPAMLDTLQAALRLYEALGPTPQIALLEDIRQAYDVLNQQEAKRAFFQRQLALYQARGPAEGVAMCYRNLGSYYGFRGSFNQCLSYRLRAAELFRSFSKARYYHEIAIIGSAYTEWGNNDRGLAYLQQALAHYGSSNSGVNRAVALAYLQQGRLALALHYADLALRPSAPRVAITGQQEAFGLVLRSRVLLALGRVAEVRPLLAQAQHLADSLHLKLYLRGGVFELNAAWARYYTATGHYPQAEAAWQAAYRQSRQEYVNIQRLAYLQALAGFYQQRGQPARAAPYALAALALADTLNTAQAATYVAQYELVQADRAQTARQTRLRRVQEQAAAQARHQRQVLLYVGAGVLGLLLLAAGLYAAFRRSQHLAQLISVQKQDLQTQRDQLDASLTDLRATQAQLIQKEKMASLGELTAGIAHEIQNPLNFVNNFSEVSTELMTELEQAQAAGDGEEVTALATDVRQNLTKITEHGQRAASIVRGMLEHARASTGERAPTNINQLADEYLRLAYQNLRAKDKTFIVTLETDFSAALPVVEVVGADLGRVLLNLLSNAFYAVQQRQQKKGAAGYQPRVGVRTLVLQQQVLIQVSDNGLGMSEAVQQKVFQPFFTTKPAGEGTGLGLSLAHDIIVQGYGGTLGVESRVGQGTTFSVGLPVNGAAH